MLGIATSLSTPTRRRRAAAAALLSALALAIPAAARAVDACVSPRPAPPQSISAVRVVASGFSPALAHVVDAAMAAWNHPTCNARWGFPRFELSTELPHRVLQVRFVAGESADGPGRCGSFVGHEVVLYSHARDPRDGVLRSCGDAPHLIDTLIHELGHVLGLEDQYSPACAGHAMGQLVRTRGGELLRRQLRPAECAAADSRFLTLAEKRGTNFDGDRLAALESTAVGRGMIRLPDESSRSLPRFARSVRGSRAIGSAAYGL